MKTFKILSWLGDTVETIEGTIEDAKRAANDLTEYHNYYSSPFTYEEVK